MLSEAVDSLPKLELIDSMRKLGLSNLFVTEILQTVVSTNNGVFNVEDRLYASALRFRLLRQLGHVVSYDELRSFKEGRNTLNGSSCVDVEDMIELLEASHLVLEGENILNEAKAFSTGILQERVSGLDGRLLKLAVHALEHPMHWRVQWLDIKWQIDMWWKDLGLIEHVDFTRDQLVESFLCALGLSQEPPFSSPRKSPTKVIILILVINDVYDLYGLLEELDCFTGAITRWDSEQIQQLPDCMKAERDTGDAPSSVVCYMREANVSEDVARKHIRVLVNQARKSINAHCFGNAEMPLLRPFINATVNAARVAHMLYQFGDGLSVQDGDIWRQILSIVIKPLALD
ncbi:hypothetical protein NL676_013079 [Syzygium grande]|nr:hypothetical protein NL676_013079 [Syzygium grande]